MRRVFSAAVTAATCLATFAAAAAGPAAAEPANTSSANAYGLSAAGALPISPLITTSASQPPDQDSSAASPAGMSPSLLTLPLGTLALAGVVGVDANAHQVDNITPELTAVPVTPSTSDPVTLVDDSSRGLAKTTGLGLVFTAPTTGTIDPIATALAALPSLLSADAVSSEAVAKCVDGQPVFDTGYQIAGLGGLVGGVLDPVVQALLNTLLGLIGPGAALSSVISIAPGVVTQLPDGVAIDGLQVSVPLLNETIVVSHSEAHMAANCTVAAPPASVAPTPPAATSGPGAATGSLATTGSDLPFLPLGLGLVVAGVIGSAIVVRSRREQTASR
ncbi:MAG TPA: hypothetical protein VHS52_05625 [Acidimicrobiales bacterium]|jgi:hypothetical protein|nr:hypothetical protein [Acidimicrobiales bacterium]